MNKVFRDFYRGFYHRTGGFFPTAPQALSLFPGDFFQIVNGQLLLLGNLFHSKLVESDDVILSYGNRLNPAFWNFSEGVSKPYSGRGTGQNAPDGQFEFVRQILAFAHAGSFMFSGNDPQSVRIANFNELQQQLIVKLTTTLFSFRELYVVTESATTSDWTLAVSGADKAELELTSDSENSGLITLFGHTSSKTIQSRDIEYYYRETKRRPTFFKAKKLVVNSEKLEMFTSKLMDQHRNHGQWASGFFESNLDTDPAFLPHAGNHQAINVLDFLTYSELNPNTALLYFTWEDANADDIEKLFFDSGN